MKKNLLTLALMLLALFNTHAYSQEQPSHGTIGGLRGKLAAAKTAADSLKIYYDILDLAERKDYKDLIREMYGVATRANDMSARLDLCRQVTAVLRDDSHFAEIEEELQKIPASEEQKETELFIKMKRVCYLSAHVSEEERQKEVTKLITKFESDTESDKYEDLLDLYSLVEYLRHFASGEILDNYIGKLYKLVNDENFKLYTLPNIIYAESANVYSDAGQHERAVKADRRLLEVIDALEKKYRSNGRYYRNYDVSRYVVYRRMLRNYPALDNAEAHELYSKIRKLAEKNPDVRKDLETNPRALGFYYMAVGDYNSAIPYLKKTLDTPGAISIRRQVLEALLMATEQTGDTETRLYALTQYKHINEEYNRLKATEHYNELQIKYDLKDIQEQNASLELANQAEETKSARRIMTFLLVAFFILATTLGFSVYEWSRFRRNRVKMGRIVDQLREERNRMVEKYYDYNEIESLISGLNRSSNSISPTGKDVSVYMTECIFNNLLNIALMGGDDRLKYIQKCSVDRLMRETAAKISEKPKPLNLSVEYPEADHAIVTDRECIVDSLAHLIESMSLLGGSGNQVELQVHRTGGRTNFILTSDANLSAVRNESEIFSLLHVTDEMMEQGKNGLYICRMIAFKIDCTFTLDKTYTEGARYILSVPDDLTHTTHITSCSKPATEKKA